MNKLTLIFLGPQGSGKGTQIQLLKEYIAAQDSARAIVHFEMGKQLRERGTQDDYTGRLTTEILHGGGLIPYAISASLFAQYLMDNIKTGDEHLIVDGFPRTATQVPTLDSALTEFYKREMPVVVCINISDDEAVTRLLKRGRHDDTEESIRKRLAWSRKDTMPNIEWFRANPLYRVVDIDGERSVEEIQKDILAKLGLNK
jgi:adenylate kinase